MPKDNQQKTIKDTPASEDHGLAQNAPEEPGAKGLREENREESDLEDKQPAGDAGPEDAPTEDAPGQQDTPY